MDRTIKIRDLVVRPGEQVRTWVTTGEMADGSPLRIPVIVVNGAQPGPRLYIQAGVHGNEVVGTETVKTIAKKLDPATLKGSFIGVPVLNMASYLNGARVDTWEQPVGANNLGNMYVSAQAIGSVTERAVSFARDEILPQIEYIIDLHSSAVGSMNSPRGIIAPRQVKLADGLHEKMENMAIGSGFEVIYRADEEAYRGMYFSQNTFWESNGVAKIVLETGGAPTLTDLDTLRNGVMGVLVQLGMIPGEVRTRNPKMAFYNRLAAVRANHGGIWRSIVEVGAAVKAGQKLGEVTNLFDDVVEEIFAPEDGIAVKIANSAIAYTGIRLAVMAMKGRSN